MRKFAVIDIGSNSVRLMFVADGKVLYKGLQTTRLGEGIAEKPILNAAAIERSARAVELFYQKAQQEGAETIVAFATAAVRSAENGQEFTDRVKELCGLSVEVISGEEEAEIGILGALGGADGGVIDIGGASTEIVVKDKGEIVYKKSVNIGVVRLKDKCGRDKDALINEAKKAAKEFGVIPANGALNGIGGTATTIAAQILRLETYQSEKITGAKISLAQIQAMADKLLKMSIEEIAALPCMPKGRADVLTGGAVLLATLMEELKINTLIASDADNLEGYAIKRGLMGSKQ
jgi:exopolyphosphatase/guanosine-5'-triphosphate,3'-diphosphate pyrophosphatase